MPMRHPPFVLDASSTKKLVFHPDNVQLVACVKALVAEVQALTLSRDRLRQAVVHAPATGAVARGARDLAHRRMGFAGITAATFGKLLSRPAQVTTVSGSPQRSRLFFVTDLHTEICFLVNTGAQVSIIRPLPADLHRLSSVELVPVNRTPIKTYGERSLTLNIGIRRSLPWVVITAHPPQSIISIDYLRHFNLIVDTVGHKLIDRLTACETIGTPATTPSVSPLWYTPDDTDKFRAVLSEFPELCKPLDTLPQATTDMIHHIVTTEAEAKTPIIDLDDLQSPSPKPPPPKRPNDTRVNPGTPFRYNRPVAPISLAEYTSPVLKKSLSLTALPPQTPTLVPKKVSSAIGSLRSRLQLDILSPRWDAKHLQPSVPVRIPSSLTPNFVAQRSANSAYNNRPRTMPAPRPTYIDQTKTNPSL
ncbi:unnamed protein product [Echinostoma caproni]|uniref:Peptidase A2 domain-containing protein n=1 Tax=Echinostoma caproni TaxID=27848 RepID=A0A183B5B7_9TREM|nr:unnamed protein product [Echinostoma caproni]